MLISCLQIIYSRKRTRQSVNCVSHVFLRKSSPVSALLLCDNYSLLQIMGNDGHSPAASALSINKHVCASTDNHVNCATWINEMRHAIIWKSYVRRNVMYLCLWRKNGKTIVACNTYSFSSSVSNNFSLPVSYFSCSRNNVFVSAILEKFWKASNHKLFQD